MSTGNPNGGGYTANNAGRTEPMHPRHPNGLSGYIVKTLGAQLLFDVNQS